jgi:hypothetical protein
MIASSNPVRRKSLIDIAVTSLICADREDDVAQPCVGREFQTVHLIG